MANPFVVFPTEAAVDNCWILFLPYVKMKWFSAVHYGSFPGHTVAIPFLRCYQRNHWHYSYTLTAVFSPPAVCQALAHLSAKGNGFGMIRIFMEGHEQAVFVLFCQEQFPLYLQIALSKKWIASSESQVSLGDRLIFTSQRWLSCLWLCVSQQILVIKSDTSFTLENNLHTSQKDTWPGQAANFEGVEDHTQLLIYLQFSWHLQQGG